MQKQKLVFSFNSKLKYDKLLIENAASESKRASIIWRKYLLLSADVKEPLHDTVLLNLEWF